MNLFRQKIGNLIRYYGRCCEESVGESWLMGKGWRCNNDKSESYIPAIWCVVLGEDVDITLQVTFLLLSSLHHYLLFTV